MANGTGLRLAGSTTRRERVVKLLMATTVLWSPSMTALAAAEQTAVVQVAQAAESGPLETARSFAIKSEKRSFV